MTADPYTYQIDIGGGWISATPRGEWTLEYRQNVGQIFFRRHLQGNLTFCGDDYDNITGVADCTEIDFRILCDGSEYWTGKFSYPNSTTINEDSCCLEADIEVVDEYSCIMDNYETTIRMTNPAAGGLAVQLRTCAGGLLIALGNTWFLLQTWLNHLINATIPFNTVCGGSLTVRSSFLWRDNFPDGTNYVATYGTNNYITGAANRLEYIRLQSNDAVIVALGGTGCQGVATTYDTSFKEWETMLREVFNAYWYIDENGDFRIEHLYFFNPAFAQSPFSNTPDIRNIISNNGRSFAYRRNKYSYDTGRLYDKETWKWQHYDGTEGNVAHGTDFTGAPIYYGTNAFSKSSCVPGEFKNKTHDVGKFWSDIYWAYQLIAAGTVSTITCPYGWCMIDVDTATNYVRCEVGAISAANTINGHCSTANLHDKYHTYGRIFLNGNMNGGVVVFDTALMIQLQDAIEFTICCDDVPDPLNRIVTDLGNGKVKGMTAKKYSVEVELLY